MVKKSLECSSIDSEIDDAAKLTMRKIAQTFLGDFDENVAVLGAFDTWPYIDYVSRILANNNYVAVTSRYLYRKINGQVMRIRTLEHPGFAGQYYFMGALLDQIISSCASAIVNFSVSAAHFIEIDWCQRKTKKTLGITYARSISGCEKGSCENLRTVETDRGFYSICDIGPEETRTAWDCMKSAAYCPFIRQDISKNVIEYFFRGKDMENVAVEDIGVLPILLSERYPPLPNGDIKTDKLNNDIMKDDEIICTKECIYFILRLKKLGRSSFYKRLSPIKLMALLQKTPKWSNSIASNPSKLRYFISTKFEEKELLSCLREGFVDIDLIGTDFFDLTKFLEKREYIKLREIENMSGPQINLVKLSQKGTKMAQMFHNF